MIAEQILLYRDCREIDPVALLAPYGNRAHLITDPPYSAHVHDCMRSAVSGSEVGTRKRDAGFQPLSQSLGQYLFDCVSACPGWSLVYSDLESCGDWCKGFGRKSDGGRFVRTVVSVGEEIGGCEGELSEIVAETEGGWIGVLPWIRWSSPQRSGDRPPQGSEALVLLHGPGRVHWRGPGNLTHLEHKCMRGIEKHPTQKRLTQMLDLVSWFTDPGDLVYEPTAGSATTGVACALLGRSYVGCQHHGDSASPEEIAEARRWFDFGSQRLADARGGRLSDRDSRDVDEWIASVEARGSRTPSGFRALGTIPEQFKTLKKGAIIP